MADPRAIKTSYKNAVDLITYANAALSSSGVTDNDGNPASFTQLAGSPAWLFALANGMIATEWQEKLRAAANSFNISGCEDWQVLNLATIAGVSRKEGSSSSVRVSILNTGNSAVTIPMGTTFQDSVNGSFWATALPYTIQPGQDNLFTTTLFNTALGAVSVGIGVSMANTEFTTLTVTTIAGGVVGEDRETIAALRNRIQNGAAATDPIVACEAAIGSLSGILKCTIWTNSSTLEDLVLEGGVTVAPRSAYIVIQGVDSNLQLANTYFKYLNIPTQQTENSLSEPYVRGRQQLTVYYDVATEQELYIRVLVKSGTAQSGFDKEIQQALLIRSGSLPVGASIDEITISGWLNGITRATAFAVDVSVNGTSWRDYVRSESNKFFVWSVDTLVILETDV